MLVFLKLITTAVLVELEMYLVYIVLNLVQDLYSLYSEDKKSAVMLPMAAGIAQSCRRLSL